MNDRYPLLEHEEYEQALSTIVGFQELKNEQSAHHYEITTEIAPADEAGITVKKLQRLLRHTINPQAPQETETEFDRTKNIITKDTVDLITSAMTSQRTSSDGSSRARAKPNE